MKATYRWRRRGGGFSELQFEMAAARDTTAANRIARENGWPGHAGDRWSYFKDDLRALWRHISVPTP